MELWNQAKSESSNLPIFSAEIGEPESMDTEQLVLFTVIECGEHGAHVIRWTPEIDPE